MVFYLEVFRAFWIRSFKTILVWGKINSKSHSKACWSGMICSLRWAAITLSRVKSEIYESLLRKSLLGFPGWRVRASAAVFPKQGTACIWTQFSCWLPHLSLPREERDGETGGFHFMPLKLHLFPKSVCGGVCVCVWELLWQLCPRRCILHCTFFLKAQSWYTP